jgi:hypothetical protein
LAKVHPCERSGIFIHFNVIIMIIFFLLWGRWRNARRCIAVMTVTFQIIYILFLHCRWRIVLVIFFFLLGKNNKTWCPKFNFVSRFIFFLTIINRRRYFLQITNAAACYINKCTIAVGYKSYNRHNKLQKIHLSTGNLIFIIICTICPRTHLITFLQHITMVYECLGEIYAFY